MHDLSILLGLSASEQSKFAAEVAWSIAKKTNGKVCAQHVIDSRTMWELLRNDKPGFVGSSMHIAAYEQLSNSLKDIASKLVEKYEAVASSQGVDTESAIEEGNPVRQICAKAAEHDLVVVGHQPRLRRTTEHCNFVRYAIAEGLAHDCPRALLIVQNQIKEWKTMSILLSLDHINFSFIGACLKLAKMLDIKPEVVALASGTREEPPAEFLKDLREADKELADVPLTVVQLQGLAVEDRASLWTDDGVELDWQPAEDTLLVIPTRRTGGHRITVFDTSPDLFVRHLTMPSILMWPEEHTCLNVDGAEKKVESKV